jgi:predicted nucleic-acid-binding protein
MKGIDTNILVRFLVGDDTKQANKVYKLFKETEDNIEELHVPIIVLIEAIWVLESVYKTERNELINLLSELILMPIFKFENLNAIQKFVPEALSSKFDLSDLLIAQTASLHGCTTVITFDKKASKHKLFSIL